MAEPEDTPSNVEKGLTLWWSDWKLTGCHLLWLIWLIFYGLTFYFWQLSAQAHINNISLSSHCSSAALKLQKYWTTALNEVAATCPSDGPISKSKPTSKAMTKTSKKSKIADSDEYESLEDEDDTKEREAALSSPMKGKDFQQLTAMSFTYHFHPLSDHCCRLKSRLKVEKRRHFLPMRRRKSRMMLYHISFKNTLPKWIASLPCQKKITDSLKICITMSWEDLCPTSSQRTQKLLRW